MRAALTAVDPRTRILANLLFKMKVPAIIIASLASIVLLVGCGKRERELEAQIIELQTEQKEELEQLKAEGDRLNGILRASQEKQEKTQEEIRALHTDLGARWAEVFKESSELSGMRDFKKKELAEYDVYRQERAARIARGEKVETIKTICPDDTMLVLPNEIENLSKKISEQKVVLDEIEKIRMYLETIIDDKGG